MTLFNTIHIAADETGIVFRDGAVAGQLTQGTHRFFDPKDRVEVVVCNHRDPFLPTERLDQIEQSGVLDDDVVILNLADAERALVWVDSRFVGIFGPGRYGYWTEPRDVHVEVVTIDAEPFTHRSFPTITRTPAAVRHFDLVTVSRECVGVLYVDNRVVSTLNPGRYAFWKDAAEFRVVEIDLRETQLEVGGQDVATADKVTLRLNATLAYRVADPLRAVSVAEDVQRAIYRESQLALRGAVGSRSLDEVLADREQIAAESLAAIGPQAERLGLALQSFGVRDVILPGDMKELLNRVIEAKKEAEANLIVRREETAAMRSQANTAKLLADNPTLMRLRELEALSAIAMQGNLTVVVGEDGLAKAIRPVVS